MSKILLVESLTVKSKTPTVDIKTQDIKAKTKIPKCELNLDATVGSKHKTQQTLQEP